MVYCAGLKKNSTNPHVETNLQQSHSISFKLWSIALGFKWFSPNQITEKICKDYL